MPTAATSISWLGALGWLTAIAGAGFLVTWVLTSRLGVRRTPYIAALALLTGGLTFGYLTWSNTSLGGFLTNRWGWGLVGAAVAGAILAKLSRHQPGGPRPSGRRLATTLVWEGVVYGTAEGLLLSVLPVLVTWQAFAAHGWSSGTGRALVAGTAAMAASLAVIIIHHLGYRGFHSPAVLAPVMVGCGLLSLAYLLTASPLAAVGGHIILHTALNLRGTEMPPTQPELPMWFLSDINGQQPRRPPRSGEEVREPGNHRGTSRHQDSLEPDAGPRMRHGDQGMASIPDTLPTAASP